MTESPQNQEWSAQDLWDLHDQVKKGEGIAAIAANLERVEADVLRQVLDLNIFFDGEIKPDRPPLNDWLDRFGLSALRVG
jgi:hypothetical protein